MEGICPVCKKIVKYESENTKVKCTSCGYSNLVPTTYEVKDKVYNILTYDRKDVNEWRKKYGLDGQVFKYR